MIPPNLSNLTIVFFDGYCGLCNRIVNMLLRLDKKNVFTYSPLQGETALNVLNKEEIESLQTIVLYHKGNLFIKSAAVFQLIKILGGAWKILLIGEILPTSWADSLYLFVSKNRLAIFGKRNICRIPTKDELKFFLP